MRALLRWKVFIGAVAFALFASGQAEATSNLDYTDSELERLLLSLDIDSKFAALSIVQSGAADLVQHIEVNLMSSVEEASSSTISILLSFKLDNPAEINSAKCQDVLARAMTFVLGGKWQKITENGEISAEATQKAKADLGSGLSGDLQLPDIERRMIGYVGSREDVLDESSPERIARWKRYIQAYNALKFQVHLTYQDILTGTFTRQRCTSRDANE